MSNVKIKAWDEFGQPIFKGKGDRKALLSELDEFFGMKD